MSAKFQELVKKLKEMFQLDRPDLDFGLYKILHTKSAEITDFLENRLAAKVQDALSVNAAKEKEAILKEIEETTKTLTALKVDPESNDAIKELKAKLGSIESIGQAETEVYSHLLNFFSRYYDEGDFMSKRRYNGDKYAIPYAGEEVKLHWANSDQY